jgi:hypothetical protein
VDAGGYVLSKILIFEDHPDIAYLERYAHACCAPFGAAEQRKGAGSTSRVLFSMIVITSLARTGFPADVISCPFR